MFLLILTSLHQHLMFRLSLTKSCYFTKQSDTFRCWSAPSSGSAVSTVNLSTHQMLSACCPATCCTNAIFIHDTQFLNLHCGRLDYSSLNFVNTYHFKHVTFKYYQCNESISDVVYERRSIKCWFNGSKIKSSTLFNSIPTDAYT